VGPLSVARLRPFTTSGKGAGTQKFPPIQHCHCHKMVASNCPGPCPGRISPPHSHRPAFTSRSSLFHSIPELTRPRFRGRSLCNSLMAMEHWAGLFGNCGRSPVWISYYYHLARGLRCLSLSAAWVRIYLKAWAITIAIQAPQRFSIACVGIDHHGNQTSDPADIRKPQITDPTIEFTSAREQVLANCLVSNVSRTC